MGFNPGISLTVSETPTPAKLNSLMDDAGLTGLVQGNWDAAFGLALLSAPASPVQGDCVVSSSTGEMEFYDSVPTLLSQARPETISLTNNYGQTLATGDVVMVDETADFSCTATPGWQSSGLTIPRSTNVLGPVTQVTAPGDATPIAIRGIALCRISSGSQGAAPGDWLFGPLDLGFVPGRDSSIDKNPTIGASEGTEGSSYFAICLSSIPAGTVTLGYCMMMR